MIKLSSVYKDFQIGDESVQILNDINLTIDKGEFVSILGPSGSGKSTLMYLIGLLDNSSKGEVRINNINTSTLSDNEKSKLRNEYIGFIFQQFNLINKLTVLENVLVPISYIRKKLNFDPQKKAEELLKRFGLDHRMYSFPNKISGGEQQRVAIVRALILNPQIILADEPTGNLDTKTGMKILELLSDLNTKERITIIVVTHDINVANKTKRRIEIIDGQIK